ncbi:MAG: NADH-quinone oxidoreductase subunit L [Chloroflexi bacterium]|nr:MAG: NADH-quinone oxidoreductase subunit L [Chloroflexota bacterium]RLC95808.1 MAG: NADH-quinone oxidoreductase subunit L [Chloroflexota bacterium]
MAVDVAFWILAVLSVVAALAVIMLRDVFRAALFLILCFFTVAGIYVTLNAGFLAAVQVLIYIGAIAILLIFAIMFTRDAQAGNPSGRLRLPAGVAAVVLLGVMISSAVTYGWLEGGEMSEMTSTGGLGQLLFSENGFVLPLEIAGVMLLAAALGAIAIMREK